MSFEFSSSDFFSEKTDRIEPTIESNSLKLSGVSAYCDSITRSYSKIFRPNAGRFYVGVSFVFFTSDFSPHSKSGPLSQPLNQIASNFQGSFLIMIRFNAATQIN